jgi:hypothetical protein
MRNLLRSVPRQSWFTSVKRVVLSLSLLFLVTALGCDRSKENSVTPDSSNGARIATHSFLKFKNPKEFNQALNKLLDMTDVQKDAWENSQKFTSLRKLYNTVVNEEAANTNSET